MKKEIKEKVREMGRKKIGCYVGIGLVVVLMMVMILSLVISEEKYKNKERYLTAKEIAVDAIKKNRKGKYEVKPFSYTRLSEEEREELEKRRKTHGVEIVSVGVKGEDTDYLAYLVVIEYKYDNNLIKKILETNREKRIELDKIISVEWYYGE